MKTTITAVFALFLLGAVFAPESHTQTAVEETEPSEAPTADTQTEDESLPAGIAEEQPEEGHFVQIENGPYAGRFMIPYEATIPGSKVNYLMTPIPGGTTLIGSPDDEDGRGDDEGPQFSVTTEPFWMGVHEITWDEFETFAKLETQFKELAKLGIRQVPEVSEPDGLPPIDAVTVPSQLYDPDKIYSMGNGLDEPAGSISQYGAKQYTKWLSLLSERFYRLPTEAEWEHACRAGTTTAWYFGDDEGELENHGWFYENGNEEREVVGQLESNPWGLYDMYGNVAEWTLDKYTEEFWRGDDPNDPRSPWWLTTQAPGAGFRIIRPLNVPDDENEKRAAWDHDIPEIFENARDRINSHGKGSYGIVDPELPADLEKIE